MTTEIIKFKVAMNNEEKLAKNTYDVEVHVERPVGIPDIIWDYAIANYKVRLQGQIRPNWDKFIEDTFPKTLNFGDVLYAKTTKAAKPVTMESATKFFKQGTLFEQMTKKIEILKSMGLDVPQHMQDTMDGLAPLEDVTPA